MPEIIIDARTASLGPNMSVNRILPFRERRMVGPFIFMDHAGPVNFQGAKPHEHDVLPHPHIGLSTVSYLLNGSVTHRDSIGVEQVIAPGDVNWMTAGKGISHSERFEDPNMLAAGKLELLQTWVALPEADEECEPEFHNYKRDLLPAVSEPGVWMRLIAGEAFGVKSDVKTHSPLFYLHVQLNRGAKLALPRNYTERAIYVVAGNIEVAHVAYHAKQMIVFRPGEDPAITATTDSVLMLLGGEPLGKRHIWWNFVSSRKERIEQAKADWKNGRIDLPAGDHDEFVPLPEDKRGPAPELLS